MNKDQAKAEVIRVLSVLTPYNSNTIGISYWDDSTDSVGIRVSEVSFRTGNSGEAYMHCDLPHGLLVCAAVERYILDLMYVDDVPDDRPTSLWNLLEAMGYSEAFVQMSVKQIYPSAF